MKRIALSVMLLWLGLAGMLFATVITSPPKVVTITFPGGSIYISGHIVSSTKDLSGNMTIVVGP